MDLYRIRLLLYEATRKRFIYPKPRAYNAYTATRLHRIKKRLHANTPARASGTSAAYGFWYCLIVVYGTEYIHISVHHSYATVCCFSTTACLHKVLRARYDRQYSRTPRFLFWFCMWPRSQPDLQVSLDIDLVLLGFRCRFQMLKHHYAQFCNQG